ncbi:CLUMA_CG015700, isoform A [Clunio marinus]|uniref:CLUMA_CG015700, isoform A n=1 Tax=Clunio marinus TaxID=568069 RepID=A0A1J1IQA4_9DIPT|nr:CLUMA_CG015700, isoform A [Clunio marinus]
MDRQCFAYLALALESKFKRPKGEMSTLFIHSRIDLETRKQKKYVKIVVKNGRDLEIHRKPHEQ